MITFRNTIRGAAVGSLVVLAVACASDDEPAAIDSVTTNSPQTTESVVPSTDEPTPTTESTVAATTTPPTTEPEPACPDPVANTATQPAGTVAAFDASAGEFTEGVTVDQSGNVFVSLVRSGRLLKFAPGSSESEVFGEIPGWEFSGSGFLGLAVDDVGNVYGAAASGESSGVWKFDCRTGDAERIDGTEGIGFPNALAFDDEGNLYLSDSFSNGDAAAPLGAIWRINTDGSVEKWMENESLAGTGAFGFPTPVGANGIAYRDGTVYIAVIERLAVLSIPVLDDGTPGEIATVVEGGVIPDGIALDADGRIYAADVGGSAIRRINSDGTTEVLAEGPASGLDVATSIAFGIGGTELTLYAVNLSVEGLSNGLGPALVAIDVDTPGQLPPR